MDDLALRIAATKVRAIRPGLDDSQALAAIRALLTMGWRPPALPQPLVEPHRPMRGSDIDVWIKRWRDSFRESDGSRTGVWYALDDLLDNYREHADTGTPLVDEVQGPQAST